MRKVSLSAEAAKCARPRSCRETREGRANDRAKKRPPKAVVFEFRGCKTQKAHHEEDQGPFADWENHSQVDAAGLPESQAEPGRRRRGQGERRDVRQEFGRKSRCADAGPEVRNLPDPPAPPRPHPERPRNDKASTARHPRGSRSCRSGSPAKTSCSDFRTTVSREFVRIHSRTQLPPGARAGVGVSYRGRPRRARRRHPRFFSIRSRRIDCWTLSGRRFRIAAYWA